MGQVARAARLALACLTIVPVRFRKGEVTDADLAASRFAYPVVGGLIGLVLAMLSWELGRLAVPAPVAGFLLLALGVAITGGLHLDGLADTFDGLFLSGDPARRLAAMRDPHVGSFGVAALVLTLLGKFAALGSLASSNRASALFGAAVVGRSLILVSAGSARYGRPEGTGRLLIEATTTRDALAAAAVAIAVAVLSAGRPGLIAAVLALAIAWTLTDLARRRFGGITGDILGSVVELGEVVYLVTLAA